MELLNCPFCGGSCSLWADHHHRTAVYLGCDTMGCFGHYLWHASEDEAIAAWNRRTPAPAEEKKDE